MIDQTYVKADIDANPAWKLAWRISEMVNDNAPIGWGRYVRAARLFLANYTDEERERVLGDIVLLESLLKAADAPSA